jgi:hypothetical protein
VFLDGGREGGLRVQVERGEAGVLSVLHLWVAVRIFLCVVCGESWVRTPTDVLRGCVICGCVDVWMDVLEADRCVCGADDSCGVYVYFFLLFLCCVLCDVFVFVCLC